MSLLIVGLDNTIVNVALPSIGRELHTSVSGLQWTVDAYTLVLASLLMLSGSMADRLGRKRVFSLGLMLFTLGSLLCSVAPSLELLVVFRMMQAVGGSMLNPVAMSIIRNVFTDARERAQAIGVWGATVGISLALGPVVGGALVESAGWRSIFWINIPVGLAALALTRRFVPESRAPHPRRAGLCTLPIAAMTLIFAPLSGRLVGRRGPRLSLLAGGIGITFGAALLTRLGAHTSIPSLVPAYVIFGIGFGMVNPPITNTAVLGMPPAQAGVAAAVASTSRQLGQTLGVAVVGAVAAAGAVSVGPGFVPASHAAWWIVTGCGAAVLVLGFASTSEWANASAQHVAEELRLGEQAQAQPTEPLPA